MELDPGTQGLLEVNENTGVYTSTKSCHGELFSKTTRSSPGLIQGP